MKAQLWPHSHSLQVGILKSLEHTVLRIISLDKVMVQVFVQILCGDEDLVIERNPCFHLSTRPTCAYCLWEP